MGGVQGGREPPPVRTVEKMVYMAVLKILFIKILFENDPQYRRKKKINLKKQRQTLNGRLPPEDSSVFDDSVCVLIVMT